MAATLVFMSISTKYSDVLVDRNMSTIHLCLQKVWLMAFQGCMPLKACVGAGWLIDFDSHEKEQDTRRLHMQIGRLLLGILDNPDAEKSSCDRCSRISKN
uniref:Uncharacterized protein n=1 Tax=Oryza brachyantha TaxID=4533 RepID=J3L901_ORYBR